MSTKRDRRAERSLVVKNGASAIAVAAMTLGAVVGCSSAPPAAKPERGTLPAGAAQISVQGKDATTEEVHCLRLDTLTVITTGTDTTGATVMVSNAGKPVVEFVRVRNLSDFTGDYNLGLEGDATVAMTGPTYHIDGKVRGFSGTSVETTTEPFAINATC